jgi:two-component system, sensor histidine kinase and response regulator
VRLRLIAFADTHPMDELLTATLDEIEALTGSTIGFYHFLEPDQTTLSLQNWSTNTLKNMCTATGKGSHYDVAQAGVWVDCVHARRPVIHNDYAALPDRKGMPAGHAPVVRELVVPIFRGKVITAIIGVGNKSADYTEHDLDIISQLGDLCWDIAERKRAEDELRQYQGHLEELVTERTAALKQEIMAHKRMEEALRKAKEEWECTFNALPELIAIIDTRHRILQTNQAMAECLGLTPAACVGIPCYQAVHGLDAPPSFCPHQQVLQDRQAHTAEVFEEGLGGDFLVTASPLFDARDNVFGSVHIARNIDEQKRFEEQLQDTAKAAETANHAKSEFLANMSHEIRTPLNAILGFAEILEGKITDTQQRQYVSLIRASGKTLLRLINDILDLSKIEARKLELQYGAVNPRLVCQEVAQIFSEMASEKGLDFILELDPKLPQNLLLDEIRLRQILLNLIGNAMKFTETGGVTVRVSSIGNDQFTIDHCRGGHRHRHSRGSTRGHLWRI